MQKHESQSNAQDQECLKNEETSARDFSFGQILDVQSTPEDERIVLWKLDLV